MFDNLTNRLSGVIKTLRGQARLTEVNIQDALREVRMALLEADVALPVVKDFIAHVKERAQGQEVLASLTPGQVVIGIVHQEMARLMGGQNAALNFTTLPPAVILMAGLQGAGKTTTSAKLAKYLREQMKKKVLLASCDVYRPAAMEQLRALAQQIETDYFPAEAGQSPEQIALAARDYADKHFHDVLIIDTAGRLAIDEAMMAEIQRLHEVLKPIETLFVVDAMQGQDAVNTAKAFSEALPLTGVVLTKLDGDARGGAALSVRQVTGKPIKFAGVGEKVGGLEAFHPERMASRILGMGDVLSLIEEAHRGVDQEEAIKLAKKMKSGKSFDLEDFKAQLQQMKKMGGVAALMDKLPAQMGQAAAGMADDKSINRIEGIINSMTPGERRNPALLKASRKRRIAAGAGVQVQEVNRLLNQFEQTQKMMKMVAKGGMAKMMRGMKGMLPGM
ncbi:MAG: signal recognition particle protein [Gammaproteobacteria bacterium]|nr:signal recognition particle protein [Gammaproteobacteria bacterium]MBU1978747.1 signal recognition particle protein [Gammaproteobacteria bacterium]